MKLHTATQEGLLSVLCYESECGAIAASMLKAHDFDPVYKEIAELAIDYHNRHKMAPCEHTVDLFNIAAERDTSRAELFERLMASVESTAGADQFNPEFMLERASAFVRYQRLKGGIEGALRDLMRDTEDGLTSAEAKLSNAMQQTEIAFDPGVTFIEDMDETLAFLDQQDASFPTGIPEFDKRNLGPSRSRLHMLIAQTNKGKSWWLIHLAVCARKRGLNVLYIGLEMTEDEVNERMVQAVLSVSKRDAGLIQYQRFQETEDTADAGSHMKTVTMKKRPTFQDPKIGVTLRRKLRKFSGQGRTIVKEFPQGTLTVEGLDNYITILESRENFIPDLLLVDYVDIMQRPKGVEGWEGLRELSEGLRRIAQQRKLAAASVSQVTSDADRAATIDIGHTSGSRDKGRTADTLLTYSQTDEEQQRGIARLFAAKVRGEEGRFTVMISQAYAVGQFVLDSVKLGGNYLRGGETATYKKRKDTKPKSKYGNRKKSTD